MPTLARLQTCTITMYASDHPPPHIHVRMRDGRDAIMVLGTMALMSGTMSPRELLEARAWAEWNRAALQNRWKELNP